LILHLTARLAIGMVTSPGLLSLQSSETVHLFSSHTSCELGLIKS
jgi:hypothetical protein